MSRRIEAGGQRQISGTAHSHSLKSLPRCRASEEASGDLAGTCGGAGLLPCRLDEEFLCCSIRFQIEAADECSADHEWQAVVAELPFLFWRVDLDAIVEVEEPLGPWPVPDHRVEWREESVGREPSGHSCFCMEPSCEGFAFRIVPGFNGDGEQCSRIFE